MRAWTSLLAAAVLLYGCVGSAEAKLKLEAAIEAPDARYFVEFRARKTEGSADTLTVDFGHAFVLAGQIVGGKDRYFSGYGYYADLSGGASEFRAVFDAPGKVYPDLDAARDDDAVFRVYVSRDQAGLLEFMAKQWDNTRYSLLMKNCVSFMEGFARAIGMQVPSTPVNMNPGEALNQLLVATPAAMIKYLNEKNSPERPLEFAVQQATSEPLRNARARELQLLRTYRALPHGLPGAANGGGSPLPPTAAPPPPPSPSLQFQVTPFR